MKTFPVTTLSPSLIRGLLAVAALSTVAAVATAKPWWMRGVESNNEDFLPPDVAFRLGVQTEGNLLRVHWVIADGYYLYRSKIDIKPESPDLTIEPPQLPRGNDLVDPYFGTQQVFRQQAEATARFARSDFGAHPLQFKISYQGCASGGLCYPVITKVVFPAAVAQVTAVTTAPGGQRWEAMAIIGGALSFLWAGMRLRPGRKLETPSA